MKIAMIGHKRIPSREGGIEIVVEELATRFSKMGHNIVVYNRRGKHVADNNIKVKVRREYKGIKIINIPTINIKGFDALIYSMIATLHALFCKYDIIHYHAEGPCVMLLIPHLFGIKTIATIHGLDWQRAKWNGLAAKYLKLGEKIAAKYADEIIVLSKNVQTYFLETYNRKTTYIPNGVNIPEPVECNIITSKYNLHKNEYLLFLARIVPEKGVHYLIEAYNKLSTDIKLVIAGGGSHTNKYFSDIKEFTKENPKIIMTGFVQGMELKELFSNCRMYILPSDIEGMPLSLLEAMSYKRRCLVSDIKENTEVIKDNSFTFRKSDINSLSEMIQKELNRTGMPDDSDIGEYKSYDMSDYDWDVIAEKHLEIYNYRTRCIYESSKKFNHTNSNL